MFDLNQRGNIAWLLILAAMALILIASGGGASGLGLLMIGAILLFLFARDQLPEILQNRADSNAIASPASNQTTASARAAIDRARDHPDYSGYNYVLRDTGVIIDEIGQEGMKLRQVRFVSLDDDAIRPYIVLQTRRGFQARQVVARFEISDSSGERQFVCEMEYWMRPGENLLLPDYRLRLKDNDRLHNTGKWDLQVRIDENLVGIHTFDVSPSADTRRQQFGSDGEAQESVMLESDPVPLSLDELLSQQNRSSSGNS